MVTGEITVEHLEALGCIQLVLGRLHWRRLLSHN
jgi:hypothetical protein